MASESWPPIVTTRASGSRIESQTMDEMVRLGPSAIMPSNQKGAIQKTWAGVLTEGGVDGGSRDAKDDSWQDAVAKCEKLKVVAEVRRQRNHRKENQQNSELQADFYTQTDESHDSNSDFRKCFSRIIWWISNRINVSDLLKRVITNDSLDWWQQSTVDLCRFIDVTILENLILCRTL